MPRLLVLALLAICLLSACQSAAPAAPAAAIATNAPAQPTAAPPTDAPAPTTVPATVTAAPTDVPPDTATVAPTAAAANTATPLPSPTVEISATVAVSATKSSLPGVSPETFVGTWTQFDVAAGGDNFLIFRPDGTFTGRHGPDIPSSIVVFSGTFKLDGDQLTLYEKTKCPDGETFMVKFNQPNQIHYTVVKSDCKWLAEDFQRQPNWQRLKTP